MKINLKECGTAYWKLKESILIYNPNIAARLKTLEEYDNANKGNYLRISDNTRVNKH